MDKGPMFRSKLDSYYTDFEDWLAIATSGLADAAKARVVEEMSEHHAEAVADRVANGVSRADAEEAALRELGSPVEARREYERHYPDMFFAAPHMRTFDRYQRDLAAGRACVNRIRIREVVLVLALLWIMPGIPTPGVAFDLHANPSVPYAALVLMYWGIGIFVLAPRIARPVAAKWGDAEAYRMLFAASIAMRTLLTVAFWSLYTGMDAPIVLRALVPAIFTLISAQEIYHWQKIRPALSG